jgi:hypothetical protein
MTKGDPPRPFSFARLLRVRAASVPQTQTETLTQLLHPDDLVILNSGSNHSAAIGSEN